ncbi:sodium/glutamate symporter [Paraglaciecola sp. 25GB23A]|uniref:sodium/glutamate symporter n=1 Tax=Paraglaciecola sp. 25GB23A TaxID=3156068 RepID=UPI0032AFDD15
MLIALTALSIAAVLLTIGFLVIHFLPVLKHFHLPVSIVAGLLGLLFAHFSIGYFDLGADARGIFPEKYFLEMKQVPGIFINIVFATLMLGMPKFSLWKSMHLAAPNIVMGHAYAWGQHFVGALLAIFVFSYFYENSQYMAPLIAIGFQGGHGTAAGLTATFDNLNFTEAVDLGLGVATGGVLIGLISGIVIFKIVSRKDQTLTPISKNNGNDADSHDDHDEKDKKKTDLEFKKYMVSKFSVQMGFIVVVIFTGWVMLKSLVYLESYFFADSKVSLMAYIPLFPMVLISSIFINAIFRRTRLFRFLDRKSIEQIGTMSLDFLIVCAVATLDLNVLMDYKLAVGSLLLAGLVWNIGILMLFARFIYPSPWYVYAMPDYGGATATTASGLLLADVADPNRLTSSKKAYMFKQPFYEPFMGGGFVTALSIPLIKFWGIWSYLSITAMALMLVFLCGFLLWRKQIRTAAKVSS